MWNLSYLTHTNLCILFIIIVIIICYYIYQNNKKYKVVSVYKNDTYFGLGDYIRGIIHLYQVEKVKDIKVDYSNHPISKYIKNAYGNNDICFEKPIVTNEKTYRNLTNEKISVCIEHNGMPDYPIEKNIKEKVKKIFTPKKILEEKINSTMESLKLIPKKFVVLHIRIEDDQMMVKNVTIPKKIKDISSILQKMNVPVLVLSNSYTMKQMICKTFGFLTTSTKPIHTGLIHGSGDVGDTLLDFFLVSQSVHIYQYTNMENFQSGFTQRIAELYDIPTTQI